MKRKVTKTCGTIGVAMITIALCLNGLKFLGARLLNWFSLARTQLPQWIRSGGQYKARLTNSTKLPRRQHQAGIPRCPPDSGKKNQQLINIQEMQAVKRCPNTLALPPPARPKKDLTSRCAGCVQTHVQVHSPPVGF